MKKTILLISIFTSSISLGYTTFNISDSLAFGASNALGLAVNPDNGHIFISTLSYSGQDNLYEFDSSGNFVHSTRVPFDTGPQGNLGRMTVGQSGHLYINAVWYSLATHVAQHYILETSQDGQTIYSSLPDVNANQGLSCDPVTQNLFYLEYLSPQNYSLNEITTNGDVVSQFNLDEPTISSHYAGLAYDPLSEDYFVSEYYSYANILDRYSKNASGEYAYVMSYDMKSIGLDKNVFDIDINRSTGMFYAQHGNEQVVIFDLDELDSFYVPEPASAVLLIVGAGLFRCGKRKR